MCHSLAQFIPEPPQGFTKGQQQIVVGRPPIPRFGKPQGFFGAAAVIPPSPPLLDVFPGAVAAYSTRLLRTAYTGSAIRVRRSSDNTELDIGFVNGGLDVAALQAFVGPGDGLVVVIYDQSENGLDLNAQTESAKFPKIIIAGILQISQGIEAMNFDGIDDVMFNSGAPEIPTPANQLFVFIASQKTNLTNSGFDFNINSPFTGATVGARVTAIIFDAAGTITWDAGSGMGDRLSAPGTIDLLHHVHTLTKSAGTNNQKIKQDGIELASQDQDTPSTVVGNVAMGGGRQEASPFGNDRLWHEFIIYTSDEQNNILGIENNIINYWNTHNIIDNEGNQAVDNEGNKSVFN